MLVGLHDAEKDSRKTKARVKFPNFALMKLSAWHKAQGDIVECWNPEKQYDRVYSSKVFDFTPTNPLLPADTIRGGTGYGLYGELPPEIDACYPDYSIYPDCDYAIGFLTRGCIRKCRWCVVPRKEGSIRPYANWRDIVRPDSKKLVLMDNNILACDYGIQQLAELAQTDYKIDLNQGLDARLVTADIAKILSAIRWQEYIRFSCDQKAQLPAIAQAVALLHAEGVRRSKVFVYLLVTADIVDAEYRVEELKRIGVGRIFAQAEQNPTLGIVPNKEQRRFTRWMYMHNYRKESWDTFCIRDGAKKNKQV